MQRKRDGLCFCWFRWCWCCVVLGWVGFGGGVTVRGEPWAVQGLAELRRTDDLSRPPDFDGMRNDQEEKRMKTDGHGPAAGHRATACARRQQLAGQSPRTQAACGPVHRNELLRPSRPRMHATRTWQPNRKQGKPGARMSPQSSAPLKQTSEQHGRGCGRGWAGLLRACMKSKKFRESRSETSVNLTNTHEP